MVRTQSTYPLVPNEHGAVEGEQHLKPPELLALSNGENPLTARAVARAMLTGTESGRPSVLPGAGPKAIRWATGAIPGLLFRYIDAKIARARKQLSHASPDRGTTER